MDRKLFNRSSIEVIGKQKNYLELLQIEDFLKTG